jgi:hypothetical protein
MHTPACLGRIVGGIVSNSVDFRTFPIRYVPLCGASFDLPHDDGVHPAHIEDRTPNVHMHMRTTSAMRTAAQPGVHHPLVVSCIIVWR